MNVQLRIREGLLNSIDRMLEQQPEFMPRHAWIIQTLTEKLETELRKQIERNEQKEVS